MFKINWSLITNDECEKLEASLNTSFAKLKLPDFVDKISVSEVNLGDVAPLIELMDISAVDPQIKARVTALGLVPPSPAAAGPSGAAAAAAAAAGAGGPMSPGGVGVMPAAGAGSGLAPRGSFTPKGAFGTAGSGTFGSPAATGALNALHLKPAQTPGAAGGGGVHPSLRRASTSVLSPGGAGGHYASTLPTAMSPSALGPALPLSATHDDDVMIKVKLHYNGNARFNIHSGLLINFPSPGFAALPITLRVSKLSFEGTAMIIKIGQTMYFTFENDPKTGGPLKDSDIGDADKSVLRNARKVEQFIINQLQTLLKEKMVYPRMVPTNLPAGPKPPGGAHPGSAAAAAGAASPNGASALTGAAASTPLPPDFKSKK